jgi:hypothetical protein
LRASGSLLAGAILLAPHGALAFELETTNGGTPLKWGAAELAYDVVFELRDPDGDILSRSTRSAIDTWSIASRTRLRPHYLGPTRVSTAGDAVSTIEKLTTWDASYGERGTTVAFTALHYDTTTGELHAGDIFLNADAFLFEIGKADAFDPESAIVHEVGHLIGFAHSCGDPGRTYPSCFDVPDDPPGTRDRILGAVMAPTLSTGTIRRVLGADDLAGLMSHYSTSSSITPPRPSSISRECPGGGLVLHGEGFPGAVRFEARYASGVLDAPAVSGHDAMSVRFDDSVLLRDQGDIDLVVRDESTHAYGSLVAAVIPPTCTSTPTGLDGGAVKKPESRGGCRCGEIGSSGRQGVGGFATLIIMLAFTAFLRRRLVALAAAALVLAGASPEAFAFKCTRVGTNMGASLIWSTRTIPWFVNSALTKDVPHDEALVQIRLAFQAWQDVVCSDLQLPFMGEQPGLKADFVPNGPNQNVVVFVETMWTYDVGVVAVTTNAFDPHTGVIYDSDIELNGQYFKFVNADDGCDPRTGAMDVRNALTHEVGHVLGLDHPPNEPQYEDDTMFASAPPCETTKRTLKQDDIDGICSIYPKGQPNHQCFPPEGPNFTVVEQKNGLGGCSDVEGRAGASSAALIALGALLLLRRRRRSERGPATVKCC